MEQMERMERKELTDLWVGNKGKGYFPMESCYSWLLFVLKRGSVTGIWYFFKVKKCFWINRNSKIVL